VVANIFPIINDRKVNLVRTPTRHLQPTVLRQDAYGLYDVAFDHVRSDREKEPGVRAGSGPNTARATLGLARCQ
jgi:hypothetical protein